MTKRANTSQAEGAGEALSGVIARAKRELQQMIDVNPDALVLLDDAGIVLRVNRAFLACVGMSAFAEVLGKPLAQLLQTDAEALGVALRTRLAGGRGIEYARRPEAGTPRLLRLHRVDDGGGGMIVLVEDVTEEKEASVLLEKAYKVEAVRALMGALMHHLNQPLTVVMLRARLMLQQLERGRANVDELKSTLEDITAAAMRVANTLRRVENSREYATQEYVEGLEIMTIDAAETPPRLGADTADTPAQDASKSV